MQNHDEKTLDLLTNIKAKISEITSGDNGMLVYLKETAFFEGSGSRGLPHGMITVSCLFINEENEVCADLFITGSAGFMECIYGNAINGIGIKGLNEINLSLMNGRWYVSENPGGHVKSSKKFLRGKVNHVPFKFSFLMRGA